MGELMGVDQAIRECLTYAFGHLVGSFGTDAHAGDSGDLARDVLVEVLGDDEAGLLAIGSLLTVAEHVAGNYAYTGEADDYYRRIKSGEV